MSDLMRARRAVRDAPDAEALARARAAVDAAKRALGERGPPWWDDGTPDLTRRAPWTTAYAEWWHGLAEDARRAGLGRARGPKAG